MTEIALRNLLALAAALLLLALPARAELFDTQPTDLATAAAAAAKQGKRLAVLFEQEDCDNCKKLRKNVFPGKAIESAIRRHYATVSVNLTGNADLVLPDGKPATAHAWAERLRVPGTPAFAFFDEKGALLYRYVGMLSDSQDLLLLGRYVAAAEFEKRPFDAYLRGQKLGLKKSALDAKLQGELCRTRS